MNKILLTLLFFLLTACDPHPPSEGDRAIDKMTTSFAKTVSPQGFHLVGLGGGLDHAIKKHKKIDIILETYQEVSDVSSARVLLVEMLVEFLNYINNQENIQEYLAKVPFTIENVHVSIICENALPGEIIDMFNNGQRLCYFVKNPDPNTIKWVEVHEETFEEAKQILSHVNYCACSKEV